MTWHQWHAAYPTESRTALSSARARANASSPHGYQSTGLSLCWRRYGLVESASRFTHWTLVGVRVPSTGAGARRCGCRASDCVAVLEEERALHAVARLMEPAVELAGA